MELQECLDLGDNVQKRTGQVLAIDEVVPEVVSGQSTDDDAGGFELGLPAPPQLVRRHECILPDTAGIDPLDTADACNGVGALGDGQ